MVKEWTSEGAEQVDTPMLGAVNKENAAAAQLVAEALGIAADKIQAGINKVENVPGRMEWVREQGKPAVLIDYAVTPDALARLYDSVRKETKGKIYAVLGACGLRDRGKRPLMARVVAERADELVLTREDPWTEDEEQIFNDLEKGLTMTTASPTRGEITSDHTPCVTTSDHVPCAAWRRIADRREAIKYCISQAGEQDVVVVTGKGAETGMAIGKEIVPWNEKKVVQELLKEKQI